jgi:hypothetical protein
VSRWELLSPGKKFPVLKSEVESPSSRKKNLVDSKSVPPDRKMSVIVWKWEKANEISMAGIRNKITACTTQLQDGSQGEFLPVAHGFLSGRVFLLCSFIAYYGKCTTLSHEEDPNEISSVCSWKYWCFIWEMRQWSFLTCGIWCLQVKWAGLGSAGHAGIQNRWISRIPHSVCTRLEQNTLISVWYCYCLHSSSVMKYKFWI